MTTDLREYLLELRRDAGILTPQIVVEAARPKDSPIHSRFEWDDAAAAAAYRLDQARTLIRSVKIAYTEPDGGRAKTRAFVSVERTETPRREYIPAEEVADDPVLTELALRDAEREWRQLYSRYKHLQEFLAIIRRDLEEAA